MSKKIMRRLTVLSGLLLIGLVALAFRDSLATFIAPAGSQPFSAVRADKVTSLSLKTSSETTEIYKKDGRWYTKSKGFEYKADTERVNQIISAFNMFKTGDIASTNKKRHEALGIGPQKLTVQVGSSSHILYIGNAADQNNYVRIGDQDTVYVASGFGGVFSPLDYRDLEIGVISKEDDVSRVILTYNGTEFTLQKQNNSWKSGELTLKKDRVDFFLNDLKTLKMTDMVKKEEFDSNNQGEVLTVTVQEKEGKRDLHFYRKDDTSYYLVMSGSPAVYTVNATYVESLKKTQAEFVE